MTRPIGRRDIVLDSTGLELLSRLDVRARALLRQVRGGVRVPVVVPTECTTGRSNDDVRIHRFLRSIDDPANPGSFWSYVTPAIAFRAGALRFEAMRTAGRVGRRAISAVDAQVAALAEERSMHVGVTILTGDVDDLQLLVDVTGRRNIAVVRV